MDRAVPEHLTFTWWRWDSGTQFRDVSYEFTIRNDPGNFSEDHGLYLMVCFSSISNHHFYFGLQTNVQDPNQRGGRGKGLIFSRFGERDPTFARVAGEEDGWYESAGYEGDFISVRRRYDWGPGDYRMRLAPDGLDEEGEWYGVWLTELGSGETVWAGSLRFPLIDGATAVSAPLYSTLEIYGIPFIRPIDIPEWHVSIRPPRGDGAAAAWGYPGYSGLTSDPWPNADVQYDGEGNVIHFRVGGVTEQVGEGEPVKIP